MKGIGRLKVKTNFKKKVMAAGAVVAVVLAAVLLAVSVYLVNYAIGRSGSGGDRDVALEVEASPDSVEAVIAANKAQCKGKIDAFTQENPGENLQSLPKMD